MQLYLENETEYQFDFEPEKVAEDVIRTVLDTEKCPYDVEVNLLITDNDGIQQYNREMRDIDRPTDVLSFPGLFFEEPSAFYIEPGEEMDYTNPESGKVILGDIIISVDKVLEQAKEYGHSVLRELSFLVIHSMLHLFGYDHMEKDGDTMEKLQEKILCEMKITRG